MHVRFWVLSEKQDHKERHIKRLKSHPDGCGQTNGPKPPPTHLTDFPNGSGLLHIFHFKIPELIPPRTVQTYRSSLSVYTRTLHIM